MGEEFRGRGMLLIQLLDACHVAQPGTQPCEEKRTEEWKPAWSPWHITDRPWIARHPTRCAKPAPPENLAWWAFLEAVATSQSLYRDCPSPPPHSPEPNCPCCEVPHAE